VDQWSGAERLKVSQIGLPPPSSPAMFTTLNPQNTGDPANNVVADRIPIPCSPDENLFTLFKFCPQSFVIRLYLIIKKELSFA
jgi:hypothetical protein